MKTQDIHEGGIYIEAPSRGRYQGSQDVFRVRKVYTRKEKEEYLRQMGESPYARWNMTDKSVLTIQVDVIGSFSEYGGYRESDHPRQDVWLTPQKVGSEFDPIEAQREWEERQARKEAAKQNRNEQAEALNARLDELGISGLKVQVHSDGSMSLPRFDYIEQVERIVAQLEEKVS